MYQEDGVLAPFRVEEQNYDHELIYKVVEEFPELQEECIFRKNRIQVYRKEALQITRLGLFDFTHTQMSRRCRLTQVEVLRSQVPKGITPRLVLNSLEAEHHIVRHGGFLLHSSFVRVGEKAILFTAPSGTGKSTQAELWRKYRGAEVINGDRTAVTVEGKGIMAHGIPYCGTSGICKPAKLPVEAIVCLSQAPQNRIEPLSRMRAFRNLWEGCSVNIWDKEDVDHCTNTVLEVIRQIPVVHLACTPDASAVETLENYLRKGR